MGQESINTVTDQFIHISIHSKINQLPIMYKHLGKQFNLIIQGLHENGSFCLYILSIHIKVNDLIASKYHEDGGVVLTH